MDVIVRYWHHGANAVKTRYLSSVFLTSAKALDFKDTLMKAVGNNNLFKILQVSMDGPPVNVCTRNSLSAELSAENPKGSVLLDIGSRGLHTVHGAFKHGIKSLNWLISKFFWTNILQRHLLAAEIT